MRFAHDVLELFQSYPTRSFRVMEIVRYATGGRQLDPKARAAARKAAQRALEALIENGTVVVREPALTSGSFAEYSMSHKRDMRPEKAGQRVGQ